MTVVERVAARWLQASRLRIGPGKIDERATATLRRVPLKANRGSYDLNGVAISAGFYAKKFNKTMYVYEGNSNMHLVYRVTYKPDEYLNPINNTGESVLSVSPDLTVMQHDVQRSAGEGE